MQMSKSLDSTDGATLHGIKKTSGTNVTASQPLPVPLGALSSYRRNRLSLKKQRKVDKRPTQLPAGLTADSQMLRNNVPAAPGTLPAEPAQEQPSSKLGAYESQINEESRAASSKQRLQSPIGKADSIRAVDQSGACVQKAAMSRSPVMSSLRLSEACVSGRQPLQKWIPRKRNLASFDALDDVPNLCSHQQAQANQKGLEPPVVSRPESSEKSLAGLPFKAAISLPGMQVLAQQKKNLAGILTASSAGLPTSPRVAASGPHALQKSAQRQSVNLGPAAGGPLSTPAQQLDVPDSLHTSQRAQRSSDPESQGARNACNCDGEPDSSASGRDLAASSQLLRHTGRTVLSKKIVQRPFAAPRSIQRRVEKPASDCCKQAAGPGTGIASSSAIVVSISANAACGKDAGLQGDPAPVRDLPHRDAGKSSNVCAESMTRTDALDTDRSISDSEAGKGSRAPDDQPAGSVIQDQDLMDGSRSTSPPQRHSSRGAPQQHTLDGVSSKQAAEDRGPAGGQCRIENRSNSKTKKASPLDTATADTAGQWSNGIQSAGRKRLKRLYDGDDSHRQMCMPESMLDTQDEDADLLADLGVLQRQGFSKELQAVASRDAYQHSDAVGVVEAGLKPILEPVSDMDEDSWSDGSDTRDAKGPPAHHSAAGLEGAAGANRSLKRLRRANDMFCEAADGTSGHLEIADEVHDMLCGAGAAVQAPPRANPFVSAKAAILQEPRLACHAAPAQPQRDDVSVSYGDMHALLKRPAGPQKVRPGRKSATDTRAAAADVIDLASDDSSGGGEKGARPPALVQKRPIHLPQLNPVTQNSALQGRQPSSRSYLGAYSSADITTELPQPGSPPEPLQRPSPAETQLRPKAVWQRERQEGETCRWNGSAGAAALQGPSGRHRSDDLQRDACSDDEDSFGRAQEGQTSGAQAQAADPNGQSEVPRNGPPWWHRLDDFVPVAALLNGRDPRNDSVVHIAYGAQFSGERQPLAAGRHGGFQQGANRGRKTERGTAPTRGDDAALRVGSGGGHWMTTHQNGRSRKVYVTSAGKKLTGAAAHAAYGREKEGAGPSANQISAGLGGCDRTLPNADAWRCAKRRCWQS